jgi:zinc transport system permease protein
MMEFLRAMQQHHVLQIALAAGVMASITCGIIGSYVVVRRISYIAGGIAHCVLGGIGAALYLRHVLRLPEAHRLYGAMPLLGAITAGLASAMLIGLISLRAKEREDTVVCAMWAIGMAAGFLFIRQTGGYAQDTMSYLVGDILAIRSGDLWLIGILDVVVVAAGLLLYNQIQATCFDPEFSRLRGVGVERYYLLLLCLTALTVVLLATVVGILMVIAMLTIPVAIAGQFARRLWQMMILATLFNIVLTIVGQAASYGPGLPPGPVIVLLSGAVYLAVLSARLFLRRRRLTQSRHRT